MSNSPQNNRQRGGGPGMAMMVPGEKAKNFKRSVKLLANRLKPFAWIFVTVTIFAIGSTTFNIFGPKLLGNATTKLFEGLMAKMAQVPGAAIDFNYIGNIALTMLGLYGLSAIFAYIQGYLISKVSSSIGYEFRKDLLDKLSRLPLSYFDKTPNGEILSRITNDVDTLTSSLNQIFTQLITSVTFLIGITIMMLSISWEMSLIAFAVLPVSFGLISIIVKFSQKYFKQQQVSLGQVNGHIEETYGGHLVVKTFNGEPQALKQFENYNNELYRSAWKSQFFSSVMQPLMGFIGHLGYISACILGGIFTIQGRISVGDIQAFIQYLQNFNQPIVQTAQISNLLQSTAAAAERIFEFLAETEEAPETDKSSVPSHIEGSVEFKDVCFGYNADQPVIQHFSASVKPGQTVAIVGPTGAGKTTLVKLLMRFYDLQQGSITVDGVDTTNYPRQQLRKMFGMVLQDTWLFNGSIRENIRYGALDANNETIEQAADTAYADHFTRALPKGYEFVLNEEASNVSAGQKQLLTIARAFIANPKILILDEATSSVDTRTEGLIQKAMVKLMKNRTCFVIAHRLSTIRNADLILVMRDGNIVEQGTHDELIAMNQFYAQLYNAQFERS